MLASELEKIKTGEHPVMLQKRQELLKEMDKKIVIADRHRKQQIKNMNSLYDFEIEDIKAKFKVQCCIYIHLHVHNPTAVILF